MGYIFTYTQSFFDLSNGKYLAKQVMYQTMCAFDYKPGKYEATTVFKTRRDRIQYFFLTQSLIFENIVMMSEYLKILIFPSKQVKTSASRICYEIRSIVSPIELESEKASDFPTVI